MTLALPLGFVDGLDFQVSGLAVSDRPRPRQFLLAEAICEAADRCLFFRGRPLHDRDFGKLLRLYKLDRDEYTFVRLQHAPLARLEGTESHLCLARPDDIENRDSVRVERIHYKEGVGKVGVAAEALDKKIAMRDVVVGRRQQVR